MARLLGLHPSDDQLDLYLLGHLSIDDESLIEEHYLGCEFCLDRLSDTADFIALLKAIPMDSLRLMRHDPPIAAAHRRLVTRIAAMLLLGAGTALLCNAPGPLRDSRRKSERFEAKVLDLKGRGPTKLLESKIRIRGVRQLKPMHYSQPHHVFQPPPQHLVPGSTLVAGELLEIPSDLIIPVDWIGEQESRLMVQELESLSLPPFHSKPHWFRRVIVAVGRPFSHPRGAGR